MDFSALKKRGSNLKQLQEQIEKSSQSSYADERIFKPGFDAKASPAGYAVVRFLPNKEGQTFVRAIKYQFNGKGGFYSEVSPKTEDAKQDDPVALVKNALWNMGEETGQESYKDKAKKFQRSEVFYANVFVEKDTINPANNGKVMIYQFGYSIFKKIEAAAKPQFEDDLPFDPFDLWGGKSLKIKIKVKEMPDSRTGKTIQVPNYEDSVFGDISELFDGDDDKKKEIYEQTYNLNEFLKFKPFDALAKRFREVYGDDYTSIANATPQNQAIAAAAQVMQQQQLATNQAPASQEPVASDDTPPFDVGTTTTQQVSTESVQTTVDSDDPLAKFRALAGRS